MSIRVRLTLWYSILLAVVLSIFSLVLYTAIAFGLNSELDSELDTRRDQVVAVVQEAVRREPLLFLRTGRVSLQQSIDIFSSPGIGVQVLRASDAATLDTSGNLGNQSLPHDAGILDPARAGLSVYTTFASGPRTRFRMLTAPISIGDNVVGIIQVAGALNDIDQTLNLLALALAIGTFTAVFLAAAVGFLLARSVLKPIDDITRAARAIALTPDLEKRVRETRNADEVDRLAITFNEMLQRLENLFRTQQRFLADVSHELRTPLTIIRGNLALLNQNNHSIDQETLKTIDGEAERMSRLLSDLLLLAQSGDAGASAIQRTPVELDTLLLDVYRQACVMAAPRDGQLKVTLGDEDQALVEGDPDRLKQLLLNLVENAIKYTPSGEVRLSLLKQDDKVGLRVSDTGMGIPAEDLPHIFERFYRVDKARSREKGGAGLGLSIADWIAQAHGGFIKVESQPGKGSTFTVWLPEKK
jgi:two-component system, OmpR family, sensor kinase